MAKWLAIILGLLLVVTNGAWIYAAIDLAVTEKYRQQIEYENENRRLAYEAVARHLIAGMSKAEAVEVLSSLFPQETPFEKEDCLVVGWLAFPLADGEQLTPGQCER